ncbi:MAG: hypothetical protein JNM99_23125 [Verrucomicrobiaceae bacterium]|nr:hypothetical protein [Verrucomicrobiaceae bacterium]
MPSAHPQPILGDPSRQAHGAIAGFDYQLWQTLLTWIRLKDTELLYVEGAEDFDVVSEGEAHATQVKAGGTALSLASQRAAKALNDYWDLVERNPDRQVGYSFVSQAGIACERARLTADEEPLIRVWNRGAHSQTDIDAIIEQLCANESCAPSLAAFLRTASEADIRKKLIHRVTWRMTSQDADGCKRMVEEALALLGEGYGVWPHDATKAAATLYQHVMLAAKNTGAAPLSRASLLNAFQEASCRVVPNAQFNAIRGKAYGPSSLGSDGGPQSDFRESSRLWRRGPPPSRTVLAQRESLVSDYLGKLQKHSVFFMHGSTGMGKTTMANLLVRKSGGDWAWWSARGMSPSETRIALHQLRVALLDFDSPSGIVLDDLDTSSVSVRGFETELCDLILEAARLRLLVVVTCQKPPPSILTAQLGEDALVVECGPFSEGDVLETANALGCTDVGKLGNLAMILIGSTRGHPQLVHAKLMALKHESWNDLSLQRLLMLGASPGDPEKEASALIAALPDSQRTLLWRLSVVHCPFTRAHALRLAELPPPATEPGMHFDSLCGPWIESLHDGYFRVSPLLEQAGSQVLSPKDLRRLHHSISVALWQRNLRDFEATAAFRHAWIAKDQQGLLTICAGLSFQKPENLKLLAWGMSWFVSEALQPKDLLFELNSFVSITLRVLQFRVASEIAPGIASKAFERLEYELEQLPDGGSQKDLADELKTNLKGVVAALPWITPSVTVGPHVMLRCLSKLKECEQDGVFDFEQNRVLRAMKPVEAIRQMVPMTMQWCKGIDDLAAWVAALDEADTVSRTLWIEVMSSQTQALHGMVEKAWLAETENEHPDWQRAIEVLKRLDQLGERHQALALRVASASSQAMVYFDYMGDPDKAFAVLSQPHLVNDLNPFVLDRLGRLDAAQGRHERAIETLERAMVSMGNNDPLTASRKAFMAVQAAHSAGKLGRLLEAKRHLELAADLFKSSGLLDALVGVHADLGFVNYELGDYQVAISQWTACLTLIQMRLPETKELQAFATRKAAGHIIAWVSGEVSHPSNGNLFKPSVAFATSVSPKTEITKLQESDWEGLWIQLIIIGLELGVPVEFADSLMPRLLEHPNPGFRSLAWIAEVNRRLESGKTEGLPEFLQRGLGCFADFRQEQVGQLPIEAFDGSHDAFGYAPYLVAILRSLALNHQTEVMLAHWRDSAARTSWSAGLASWFDDIEFILHSDPRELYSEIQAGEPPWWRRAIIAARCCRADDLLPFQYATACYQLTIAYAGQSIWRRRARKGVIELLSLTARRIIRVAFRLHNPRITLPRLEETLNSHSKGFKKAGEIVLALLDVCGSAVPSQMIEQLRGLDE